MPVAGRTGACRRAMSSASREKSAGRDDSGAIGKGKGKGMGIAWYEVARIVSNSTSHGSVRTERGATRPGPESERWLTGMGYSEVYGTMSECMRPLRTRPRNSPSQPVPGIADAVQVEEEAEEPDEVVREPDVARRRRRVAREERVEEHAREPCRELVAR